MPPLQHIMCARHCSGSLPCIRLPSVALTLDDSVMSPIVQRRKLRLKEVKGLTKVIVTHDKCQRWDLNPSNLTPEPQTACLREGWWPTPFWDMPREETHWAGKEALKARPVNSEDGKPPPP